MQFDCRIFFYFKLFKTALEEEIYKKVDKLSDIVSGNPMVIKLIVGFYKSGQGQAALRQILGPLIKQILGAVPFVLHFHLFIHTVD